MLNHLSDLEQFISARPELERKYRVHSTSPWFSVHPAHAQYVLHPPLNSIDFFLRILDEMDTPTRDRLFEFAYLWIIKPRFRRPRPGDKVPADRMLDRLDYPGFRRKCEELIKGEHLSDLFLVQAIVSDALRWAWSHGDPEQLERVVQNHRYAIEHTDEKLSEETDPKRRAELSKFRDFMQGLMESAPERQREAQRCYKVLCESILPVLYLEEPTRLMGMPDE